MADQPSSSSAPHFVLSDLLSIHNPTCRVSADSECFECDRCQTAHLLHKLKSNVSDINSSLKNLNIFGLDLCRHLQPLSDRVTKGSIRPEDVCDLLEEPQFKELIHAVKQFKLQLPCTSYYDLHDENPTPSSRDSYHQEAVDPAVLITRVSAEYNNLTDIEKKCLFCCSVFDSEIKKRVIINWWIGEKLLQDSTADFGEIKTLEQAGEALLQRLKDKRFINRVENSKRPTDAWRMEQPVRLFVRSNAKDDKFFDLDESVLSKQVMLLKTCNKIDALLDRSIGNKVKTVFNVDRLLIEENEAKIVSFMRDLNVLHLGRSTHSQKQNIRVKNLNIILKGLKKMKELRLLSLQGILLITKLPDLVCELKHLTVLDLRACQALESLPSGIGNLKSLAHLDVSGCFILMALPKELSLLVNLEILKGFVIGTEPTGTSKSCTLHDLRMLKKLHKLSLHVLCKNFPQHQDLKDLAKIECLVKLKIVWNPAASHVKQGNVQSALNTSRHWSPSTLTFCFRTHVEEDNINSAVVLEKLEKLDLWYMPEEEAQILLLPQNFTNALEKLYVRWAKIQHLNFNHDAEVNWEINMLRLLFLPNLEMSWEQLKDVLFPRLSYLEVQDCRKLQFSQYCDDAGVWKEQKPET